MTLDRVQNWLHSPPVKVILFIRTWWYQVGAVLILAGTLVWIYGLWRMVDVRLGAGIFSKTINVYAAPRLVAQGDKANAADLVQLLQRGGYTGNRDNLVGYFRVDGDSLEIHPGDNSFFRKEATRLMFRAGKISEIVALANNEQISQYLLEPQLLANYSNESRQRRRLVKYADLPQSLIHALLSIEDKRFFGHFGFDTLRTAKAVLVNLKSGRKEQGGSTLTMQLARNLWLDPEKTWWRKVNELVITGILEMRLSKKQILENYANQVYLGRLDTFDLHGLGEGAKAYFNKEVQQLTLPEAALLCGIIQRPSYFDPTRHPEEALERRNLVLSLMQKNGYIDGVQLNTATKAPLGLTPRVLGGDDAPYFVALARDELQRKLDEQGSQDLKAAQVYTTVDLELQRAATDAVTLGMARVDKRLEMLIKTHPEAVGVIPQAALVALDPKTGEIKAAVGGRDYTVSQLNRVLAKRQPGSAFKPFVYAAALAGPSGKPSRKFTAGSILNDEPTAFKYGDELYEPANFGKKYMGPVTYRHALSRSLNNATVRLAEQIGYRRVSQLAKQAGLANVHATPSIALGSYEVSPLELAGAYTVFANEGVYTEPTFLAEIRASDGSLLYRGAPVQRKVLDPRVNWIMVDLLRDVVRSGTAGRTGIAFDAAGKTGTSRDGWFAGFSSGLVCVVWVGFDDNRELPLEGANSALLVWIEFMKRASKLGEFTKPFPEPPVGLIRVEVDLITGGLPGPNCPDTLRHEWFIAGTEPTRECTPYPEPAFSKPVVATEAPAASPALNQITAKLLTVEARTPHPAAPELTRLEPVEKAAETGSAVYFWE